VTNDTEIATSPEGLAAEMKSEKSKKETLDEQLLLEGADE